jgi:uncharacterized integral membrane protein
MVVFSPHVNTTCHVQPKNNSVTFGHLIGRRNNIACYNNHNKKSTISLRLVGVGRRPRTTLYSSLLLQEQHVFDKTTDDLSGIMSDEYNKVGTYGPWKVTREDIVEVYTYRVCLSIMTLACVATSTIRLSQGHGFPYSHMDDIIMGTGILALGISLTQIHIYVTPLKRMLQLFCALGAIGYIYVMLNTTNTDSTLEYILRVDPSMTLFVGPLGAAVTGVTFKEGLCYGKKEAFVLTLLIPTLFLSHLFSAPEVFQQGLDLCVMVLLSMFALRKYTQPIEDDIGDGSIFAFQKLTPQEQQQVLDYLSMIGQDGGLS